MNIPPPYTLPDFLSEIDREQAKRRETYPNLIRKAAKRWEELGEDVALNAIDMAATQRIQFELLDDLTVILKGHGDRLPWHDEIFRELQRELRMRKQHYPRWVAFKRMDPDTAAREIAVWQAMTHWFHEEYCNDVPWRKPAKRKKKTVHT